MRKSRGFILVYLLLLLGVVGLVGCKDENYSNSPSDQLTFSVSGISLDTVFCNVPVPHKEFWAFNNTGKDLLISEVFLQRGSQTGFHVNVDGTYLGANSGYRVQNVEVCKGDSIRVYVEMTPTDDGELMRSIDDNIQFSLSNGAQQMLPLTAKAMRANILQGPSYSKEDTIGGSVPIIVYGKMKIDKDVTLHIRKGTTIFFDDEAGMEVHGTLDCQGDSAQNITLRGRRLDNMFDYLPYDRVSGQWQGIHFYPESKCNTLSYTDLHSAFNGIICDSTSVDTLKLTMTASTVHNCQGYCIKAEKSDMTLTNCQITNALNDCLYFEGGEVTLNYCTLAQFYPFDSNRGVALRYRQDRYPLTFHCRNSLITGYADDELMLEQPSTKMEFKDSYTNCVLRTGEVKDTARIHNTVFEEDDAIHGEQHFKLVDYSQQKFDFHISNASSPCVGHALPNETTTDRDAFRRKEDTPTTGCYEYR